MLGLFDFDPYGVDILKCYRIGSKASAGQKALAIPEMRWTGLKSEDIVGLETGSMPLSQADRAKAQKLLDGLLMEDVVASDMVECRSELQKMLMLNMKAEIQALDAGLGGTHAWLESKMMQELWMDSK